MTIVTWPGNLRPSSALIPVLEKNVASSGMSLAGTERIVATDAGRWRFGMRLALRNRDQMLSWRAIVAIAEGPATAFRVPVCDGLYDPAAVAGIRSHLVRSIPANGITHSDGATFSDGTGYAMALSYATTVATAAAGATSIRLTMPTGFRPDPGQMFSNGDRMYQITSATLQSGTTYRVNFRPRLRKAIIGGSNVAFDKLSCLMRFASPDMLQVTAELLRHAEVSIEFIEAVP